MEYENCLENTIENLIWADCTNDNNFPEVTPLLAHYTSVETLEKILINNEFWLSNPLYMNDVEELQFGLMRGAQILETSSEFINAFSERERYFYFLECFRYYFEEYKSNHAFDTYLTCFSEHSINDYDGRLSMWRGYGNRGKGAALILDTSKINAMDNSPLIISKVQYATTQQRIDWIKKKVANISQLIKDIESSDSMLQCLARHWLDRLKIFSLCTKHSGFAEEKEWRVIYMSDRDPKHKCKSMLGYAATDSGLEPKMKLKVSPIDGAINKGVSFENLTDRIILGPSYSSIFAEKTFNRMLETAKLDFLIGKVYSSTIPFMDRS